MSTFRPFAISLAIGVLLLIGGRFHLLQPLSDGYSGFIEPALASGTSVSSHGFNLIELIRSIKDLNKDNIALRQQNTELQSQISQYKEVQHENDILRQELNFVQTGKDEYVPAQLIGRTSTGIIKDLIVNRGTNDGIQMGQAVLAQGYLIGTINTITAHQATVMLISNPRSMIPVLTQDSRSTGILHGGISGLTLTDLLIDMPVNRDENVVTSGLGGDLPSGLAVGKIVDVTAKKGDITKSASVRSPLDVSKVEMVFVRKATQ